MTKLSAFATPIFMFALFSLVSFGSLAPALADTVTDTLPLKLTGKEWCRNDPKFFETFNVKATQGATLTLTRDVLNTGDVTDIQAKIDNSGNATIDALTLNGRALFANKSHSVAQLVLSGRDPGNPDHFFTIRGQATFDKVGKLTKVTGTYVYQTLSESGGVQDVDCFGSGTFGAQKLPSSGSGGGGGGTLTVANAPASVGGTFVANNRPGAVSSGGITAIAWGEVNLNHVGHTEAVAVGFDTATGQVESVIFEMTDGGAAAVWGCVPSDGGMCAGASVDRAAGTFTLVNTVLDITAGTGSSITLNGTLNFTPF
jgi:hypothetical protein